jgi:diguanylate cyclase (GGDEF)-like protein
VTPTTPADDAVPAFLVALAEQIDGQRPVPELGLGDDATTGALLEATRSVLAATSVEQISTAIARFAVRVGGRLVLAEGDCENALPLDLTPGSGRAVLVEADPLSVTRMRLEQYLPLLLEDARGARARLLHLEDLEEGATRDPLTGLLSRGALMRRLADAQPGDAVCLLDVDDFKALNDSAGHRQGDAVLRELGHLLVQGQRGDDVVGRYGGDELVGLQRGVSVTVMAARMRDLQERWLEVRPEPVTFSVGVAAVTTTGWDDALGRADKAMYAAKNGARNRTRLTAEAPHER